MKAKLEGRTVDIPAVWWDAGKVAVIDQTQLPRRVKIIRYSDYRDLAWGIKSMVMRGAPTIGATAAYGMALASENGHSLEKVAKTLKTTRPTAHDLAHAVDWMLDQDGDLVDAAESYAAAIVDECKSIGRQGMKLIKSGSKILTHCNAGALATVDFGTALAPMRMAKRANRKFFVFVDETRPRLQGANLTAWELQQEGITHTIIIDSAAGHYLKRGIDLVIVGADRIALNGDTANKIGTYEKAVVAKENDVPFYVAAPMSTFDPELPDGKRIPIEERSITEVLKIGKMRIGPAGAKARNPAFDVTPAKYITGFITKKGIKKPSQIRGLLGQRRK